ncbi:hypothetical protein BH11PSE6_BH11PSE6_26350 [soil metagenome]
MSLAGHAQTAIYFSSLHLDPVLFQIGPFALRWYSLAYIAGILLGWFYLGRLLDRDAAPMRRDHADSLARARPTRKPGSITATSCKRSIACPTTSARSCCS